LDGQIDVLFYIAHILDVHFKLIEFHSPLLEYFGYVLD
jgi:hypothetical protein